MKFGEKLKALMVQQGLTQAQLHKLTGIGASSISQYLSGKNEPSNVRKRDIARALGVQEDYFDQLLPEAKIQHGNNSGADCFNVPVKVIARLMGKSPEWVRQGLQDGVFPWGYAVKLTKWSYFVSSVRFQQETGITVPVNAPDLTVYSQG